MAVVLQKYLQTGFTLVSSNDPYAISSKCRPPQNYFQTIFNGISISANIERLRYWLYWYAIKLFSLWKVFAKNESLQRLETVNIHNSNGKVVIDMCCLCTFKEVIMLWYNILAMKTDIYNIALKSFSRSTLHL